MDTLSEGLNEICRSMLRTAMQPEPTPDDYPTMKADHRGPIDGRCFLGLNFTEEQFAKINVAIVDHMRGQAGEFAVEDAVFELIENGMQK